jgi:hypothetical protein
VVDPSWGRYHYRFWMRPLHVAVGSRATTTREPGQGRKAAALSGTSRVPRVAWPPREGAKFTERSHSPA